MASTGENLRTFVMADAGIAAALNDVHVSHVPQTQDEPYLWIQKRGEEYEHCLNETKKKPYREQWDFEIWGADQVVLFAEDTGIVDMIRDLLQGHTGQLGTQQVQLIEVEDVAEDYIYRGVFEDVGLYSAALDVRIINMP